MGAGPRRLVGPAPGAGGDQPGLRAGGGPPPDGGAGPTGRSTVARRRMVRTNRNTHASMMTKPATPTATFSRKVEEMTTIRPTTKPATATLSRRPRWARNDEPT